MKFNVVFFLSIMITMIISLIELTDLKVKTFAIDDSESFSNYTNSKFNFSIQYPSTWQKEERLNDFVTFLAPIEDSSHYESPAGLGISSLSVSNVSLNTITNIHLKNMTNNLKDFQLIESSDTRLADNRLAKKIIFTAMDDEEKKQALQLITKNKDKVYLITYKAYLDKYEQYFPITQKMLNSLVFFK